MIRTLVFPALALIAAIVIPGRRPRLEEYVGASHPSGEIRLSLAPAGEFRLTMAVWDPVIGAVVGHSEISGRWRRAWGMLELRSAKRRVVYRSANRRGGGWTWQRSSLPTFADGIPLVPEDRRQG